MRRPGITATKQPIEVAEAEMRGGVSCIDIECLLEPALGLPQTKGQDVRHPHVVQRIGVALTARDDAGQIRQRSVAVAGLESEHAHAVLSFGVGRIDAQRGEITVFGLL